MLTSQANSIFRHSWCKAIASKIVSRRMLKDISTRSVHTFRPVGVVVPWSTMSTVARFSDAQEFMSDGVVHSGKLFDQVDGDNDGLINQRDFDTALQLMQFANVATQQEAAKDALDRLSKKMSIVEKLEQQVADLESSYEAQVEKCDAIEKDCTLLTATAAQKDAIKGTVSELKSLIHLSRAVFNTTAQHR